MYPSLRQLVDANSGNFLDDYSSSTAVRLNVIHYCSLLLYIIQHVDAVDTLSRLNPSVTVK